MLYSRALIPTVKEAPADAANASHTLLVRGGYIRKVGAGMYDYLPLGLRVLKKIESIVREEMSKVKQSKQVMGAQAIVGPIPQYEKPDVICLPSPVVDTGPRRSPVSVASLSV